MSPARGHGVVSVVVLGVVPEPLAPGTSAITMRPPRQGFTLYNCVAFKNFEHKKLYFLKNLSLGFILKNIINSSQISASILLLSIFLYVEERVVVIHRGRCNNKLYTHDQETQQQENGTTADH